MASRGFDTSSFLIRWIIAVVLVLVTFNGRAIIPH